MYIVEGIETGVEYYLERTESWKWVDGTERWWDIFVVFHGIHGGGGAVVKKLWRWNGSSETVRHDSFNLSIKETNAMIDRIRENQLNKAKRECALKAVCSEEPKGIDIDVPITDSAVRRMHFDNVNHLAENHVRVIQHNGELSRKLNSIRDAVKLALNGLDSGAAIMMISEILNDIPY